MMTEIVSGTFTFCNFATGEIESLAKFKMVDANGVMPTDWVLMGDSFTVNSDWALNGKIDISIYSKRQLFVSEDDGATWVETPHETTVDGERWLWGARSYYFNHDISIANPLESELVDEIGVQGIPLYKYVTSPPKPTAYAWLNNPNMDAISNESELNKYIKKCIWTLYIDGDSFYLTWDAPYVEDGTNNVWREDAKVEFIAYFKQNGQWIPSPSGAWEQSYLNEPFQFNYKGLIKRVMPNNFTQWVANVLSTFTITSIDVKLTCRLTFKRADIVSTDHTDFVEIVFNGKNLIEQLLHADTIKSYTSASAPADDGSYVIIKQGLPEDDPEFSVDTSYTEPTIENDTLDATTFYQTSNVLTKTYAMTAGRLRSLGAFLWGNDFVSLIKQVNNSPIENIISIKAFPFAMAGTDEEIYVGNCPSGVTGSLLPANYNPRYDVGEITLEGVYHSFLDYSPYTKATLYLPFAGALEIDLSNNIGKKLKVEYCPDLITGIASANVYIDGVLTYVRSVEMGVDIPLSATNAGQVAGARGANLASTAIMVGATVASEGALAPMLAGVAGAGLSAMTSKVSVGTTGAGSPSCWASMPRTCYLVYDRPNYQELAMFNHTFGRVCNLSKQIGSVRGFTTISNIDLSNIAIATDAEQDELKQILSSGFYA